MISNILICFLLQITFTIVLIYLFGFIIALCNKKFYENFGSSSKTVCYVTGAIGTPIHECAHALFCIIFGHKITDIKLFQINSIDGTLGYVNHSYNPKNIYHKIGNFFIGVAPIIVISIIQFLLAWWLLPNFVINFDFNYNTTDYNIGIIFDNIFLVLRSFFLNVTHWQWWLFLFLGSFLALHMTLSKEDIKGSASGVTVLITIILIVDVIIGIINSNLLISFTRIILNLATYLFCFFMLSVIIAIFAVIISYIFRCIKRKK